MKNYSNKIITCLILTIFGLWSLIASPILAAELPSSNTNQFSTTGPIEKTGPVEATGPIEKTGPVEATGPQQDHIINATTGANSLNENSINSTNQTAVDINQNASTNNDVGLNASSGENTITKNSSVQSFSSGNIDGTVNILNTTNSSLSPDSSVGVNNISDPGSEIILNPSLDRTPLSSLNKITGSSSVNLNQANINNIFRVLDRNNAITNNNLSLDADTGNNIIDSNTAIGKIATGSIDLAVNLINLQNIIDPNLNLSLDLWSVAHGFNGDLIIPRSISNLFTGPNSQNQNNISNNTTQNISIANDSTINNVLNIDSKTGNNDISQNSFVGDIATGQTKFDGAISNIANDLVPVYYIINVFGKWSGSIPNELANNVIVNEITGANSINTNNLNSSESSEIGIENNSIINNLVNIRANTGNNKITSNTTIGDIQTGNVNILANIANIANTIGKSTKNFRLEVINIFGNWAGNIRTESAPQEVLSSSVVQQSVQVDTISTRPAIAPVNQKILESEPQTRVLGETFTGSLPLAGPEQSSDNSTTNNSQKLRLLLLMLSTGSLIGGIIVKRRK